MDPIIPAVAVLIGFVNGIRLFQEGNKKGGILFLCALVAGVAFGALHFFGLNIETGIVAALASSGLYRVAQVI